MPRHNSYSLQTIEFNPTPFQAVTFTPQAADVNILAHSLDTISKREDAYVEKSSALESAFAQMKETLPNDEETNKWFDTFTQQYRDRIQSYADNMDYAGAINAAVKAAGDAVNAAEYTGRKRYYAEREKWVDALEKRTDLKPREKDYWKRHYPQAYEDMTDSTGKIIGGNHFEAPTPVKAIDWEEAIESADKNVAEDIQGSSSSSSYTSDYGGHSSGSGRVTKKKPFNKLVSGLREYIDKNQDVRAQFNVAYGMMKDEYDDYIKERDKYEVGTDEYNRAQEDLTVFLRTTGSKNGGLPTKEEWLNYKVENSEYARLHSYENVQTESSSSKSDQTSGSAVVKTQFAEQAAYDEAQRKREEGQVIPEQGKSRQKTMVINGVEVNDYTSSDYADPKATKKKKQ